MSGVITMTSVVLVVAFSAVRWRCKTPSSTVIAIRLPDFGEDDIHLIGRQIRRQNLVGNDVVGNYFPILFHRIERGHGIDRIIGGSKDCDMDLAL